MSDIPSLKNIRRRKSSPQLDKPAADRLPPYSLESEQGVLGCVMLNPNESMAVCTMKLQSAAAFYDLRHQMIYTAMAEMYNARQPIDVVTLIEQLRNSQQLDKCGGIQYLSSLSADVPSAANLEFYLQTVIDKAMLRKMISFCTGEIQSAYESNGNVSEAIDIFERGAMSIREEFGAAMASEFCNIEVEQEELYQQYDTAAISKRPTGMPTGYLDYDGLTGGLFEPDMIVLAARPSIGKTSLAMNIVQNLAVNRNIPCGIFSLEMSSRQLIHRLACGIARVDSRRPFSGTLDADKDERGKLNDAHAELLACKNRLIICDRGGLTIEELSARARRMVLYYDIRFLVIDYLQLMQGHKRANNRQEAVSAISNGIKALAKELKLPILALCQLNREVDKDTKGRMPRISDLRESGAIEQDADVIQFLHPLEEDIKNQTVRVIWNVSKNRNGPQGSVYLQFFKRFTRFESSSAISDADIPLLKGGDPT